MLQSEAGTLKESITATDEFLAVISHELRIPIMAVLGWAELLSYKPMDQAGFMEAVEIIKRNARLEAKLIDELVDYSRAATNKLSLTISLFSLETIIKAAIDTLSPMARQKRIDIEMRLDSPKSEMEGDQLRLQQLFSNLLANAIKFTPVGGRVKLQLATSGEYHSVAVSDTGEGISAEFLPFVFDPYRQANRTATGRSGLGLGMMIARRIVKLHGGTIKADSRGKGKGAVFTVHLPRTQSKQTGICDRPKDENITTAVLR